MREKMIKLLYEANLMDGAHEGFVADYLIANGVTVRDKGEWMWKDFHKADGTMERKAVCSLCNAPNKQYTPPYCPHCGAEMERGT